jgi:hypothetical protein
MCQTSANATLSVVEAVLSSHEKTSLQRLLKLVTQMSPHVVTLVERFMSASRSVLLMSLSLVGNVRLKNAGSRVALFMNAT